MTTLAFCCNSTAQLETLKQQQSFWSMKPGFKVRVWHFVYLSVVLITSVMTRLLISLEFVIYVRWWWFKLYVRIFYWRFRFKMVAVASGQCGHSLEENLYIVHRTHVLRNDGGDKNVLHSSSLRLAFAVNCCIYS